MGDPCTALRGNSYGAIFRPGLNFLNLFPLDAAISSNPVNLLDTAVTNHNRSGSLREEFHRNDSNQHEGRQIKPFLSEPTLRMVQRMDAQKNPCQSYPNKTDAEPAHPQPEPPIASCFLRPIHPDPAEHTYREHQSGCPEYDAGKNHHSSQDHRLILIRPQTALPSPLHPARGRRRRPAPSARLRRGRR